MGGAMLVTAVLGPILRREALDHQIVVEALDHQIVVKSEGIYEKELTCRKERCEIWKAVGETVNNFQFAQSLSRFLKVLKIWWGKAVIMTQKAMDNVSIQKKKKPRGGRIPWLSLLH